ncbi:MAG: hypothetical protein K2X27_18020 [Candidatus Obscuribacterales bacterium]|nr:hypothetical protein [Candidatus Obscuribacterales bacterium]
MSKETGNTRVVSLITKLLPPSQEDFLSFVESMVELFKAGGKESGFWSGELIPPLPPQNNKWIMIQRFSSRSKAADWKDSSKRQELLAKLSKDGISSVQVDEISESGEALGSVATAIVTNVKAGKEEEYFEWERKIQIAQMKYDGYRGLYWQPPPPGVQGHNWSTLLRFDSPESLEKWFASAERKALIEESERLVDNTQIQHMSSSFPGWVPIDSKTGKQPSNWKTALLVLLGLYPIVMLEIQYLTPFLTELPPALANFIKMMASVAFTSWISMPFLIKCFAWWLFPENNSDTIKGCLIFLCIFALEIIVFFLLPH